MNAASLLVRNESTEMVKRKIDEVSEISLRLNSTFNSFSKTVEDLFSCPTATVATVLKQCLLLVLELCLACHLGLDGTQCLKLVRLLALVW